MLYRIFRYFIALRLLDYLWYLEEKDGHSMSWYGFCYRLANIVFPYDYDCNVLPENYGSVGFNALELGNYWSFLEGCSGKFAQDFGYYEE